MFVTKYTSAGEYVWTRTVNTHESHLSYTIEASDDERLLISGEFNETVDFDPTDGVDERRAAGEADAFISLWTTDGDYLWTITWGDAGYDHADAAADGNGDIIVSGGFNGTVDFDPGPGEDLRTSNGGSDGYVGKYTGDGQYLWVRTFGGPLSDTVMRMAVNKSNGDIWLDGLFRGTVDFDPGPSEEFRTSVGERDCFLMKMTCGGGGCAELTGHSADGARGKLTSTATTALSAGKAFIQAESADGATQAKGKAKIGADGVASKSLKRLPAGRYAVRVTKLKDADGNALCTDNPFERTVDVR